MNIILKVALSIVPVVFVASNIISQPSVQPPVASQVTVNSEEQAPEPVEEIIQPQETKQPSVQSTQEVSVINNTEDEPDMYTTNKDRLTKIWNSQQWQCYDNLVSQRWGWSLATQKDIDNIDSVFIKRRPANYPCELYHWWQQNGSWDRYTD